jgi:hypothetical protein
MNMLKKSIRACLGFVLALSLLAGTTGCDPTLKSTVEDGVINVSTSFFGAFLRAAFALAQEQATANSTSTTNTTTTGTTG